MRAAKRERWKDSWAWAVACRDVVEEEGNEPLGTAVKAHVDEGDEATARSANRLDELIGDMIQF